MNTILSTAIWVLPLLIIPLSYLLSRYSKFRKRRYLLYGVVTLTAFILDLFALSFRHDLIDALARMVLVFIAFETLWLLSGSGRRRWSKPVVGAAIILFAYGYRGWLWSGPGAVVRIGRNCPISDTLVSGNQYMIKDYQVHVPLLSSRRFLLTRWIPNTPFEHRLDLYKVPRCYSRTPFTCRWGTSAFGPKVDLVDGVSVLWTLGEGL